MESLDYRHHKIHFNKHTATYEDDGSVKIIVAHKDPGHVNWVETAGHNMGTMCWRWIGATEHPPVGALVRLNTRLLVLVLLSFRNCKRV